MRTGYFHRVSSLTPTKMWINNVTRKEAQLAIEAGAFGCTQNPAYTWKMLQHPDEKDYALKVLDETLSETDDDNEVVCIVQRKLIVEIANIFMKVYERTDGEHGYVSIQGDPIHEEDPNVIINEGRKNRDISPNMMIKVPATDAGLKAMYVLIEENTPLNATETMGVSQFIDIAEMYHKIITQTKNKPMMYISVITGIFDEWLHRYINDHEIKINPDIAYQAGIVIAKKIYSLRHDRNYQVGFIGGGVRGLHHFTEMVGGDVCITMNWKGQAEELLKLDMPVVSRLLNPVQSQVLDDLLEKVPAFKQAYMEKGLKVEEYEAYGPVEFFRDSFVSAWKNVLNLVKERRKKLIEAQAQ
jgi:transaldolase